MLVQFTLCLFIGVSICLAKIPDFIHPCDTIESACLTKAAQDALWNFTQGMPEYGIPVLDPYDADLVKMDLSGITFSFINGQALGLKKCNVREVRLIPKEERLITDLQCNLTIKGPYKAKGRLLLFEINGDGDAKIKFTNLGFKIDTKYKQEEDAQGVEHFVATSYKYDAKFGGRVSFALTNLFKNDPQLSQTIVAFMNENWKLVTEEFGRPITDYFMKVATKYVSKFYQAVPARELYGPSVAWPLSAN